MGSLPGLGSPASVRTGLQNVGEEDFLSWGGAAAEPADLIPCGGQWRPGSPREAWGTVSAVRLQPPRRHGVVVQMEAP